MKKDGTIGLPDDILISILSRLRLKEAACTCILSRRWRYLWRYRTTSFDFRSYALQAGKLEPTEYVNWVNEALKLHLGTCIDQMIISFDFNGCYPRDIDNWIKFAMEKGVQRFELNVMPIGSRSQQSYDFPNMEKFKFLFRTKQGDHVSRTVGSAGFCSLTTLRLHGVSITQELLENFLSKSPLLKDLDIVKSTCLTKSLKIAGSSLKLKCLGISHCQHLENLEISAINLVSFTYLGHDISLNFKNVPFLPKLCIGGEYCESFVSGSRKHSSYIPQIENLRLLLFQDFHWFPNYCREFRNLKQVEFIIMEHADDSLLSFTSAIKAAPNLSKFSVLQLPALLEFREVGRDDQSAQIDAEKEATKCHHQCLKVVELLGFVGSSSEIDLVLHVLEIATSLEKIIIDPYTELDPSKDMETARNRARQIETRLPAAVKLEIL